MDWITPEVAIGNYLEAQDATLLKHHAFRSVLSLDGTLNSQRATEFGLAEVATYRLIDGAGNDLRILEFAIDDLLRLARSHSPVLVQCHAGRSRSAVVVAGYLRHTLKVDAHEAIALIAAIREINISSELVELLNKLDI